MLDVLLVDVVDRLQRRAGELELPARLQRDVGRAALQADQGLALEHVLPAIALEALHQGVDARLAVVGDRVERAGAEHELLVLGADAEPRRGLAALRQIGRQGLDSQRRVVDHGLPHALSQLKRGGPSPVRGSTG